MRLKRYILAAIAATVIFACNEDKELTIADQEASIDTYISNNYSGYPVIHRNGSNRVSLDTTIVERKDSLVFGDSLYFYYAGYIFTTSPSSIFCTNNRDVAEQSGFATSDADYSVEKVLFTEDCMSNGLVNGLYGVKTGEHCLILFSAKYGFYDRYVYNIPKLSALAYEIWVEKVIKNN